MADDVLTLLPPSAQLKRCTKCKQDKPPDAFAKRKAHCRVCYNVVRKAYYCKPGVREEKRAIRQEYEVRANLSAKRKAQRQDPAFRAKEKTNRDVYRARPEIIEVLREYKKLYRRMPLNRGKALLTSAKARATKLGLSFALSEGWLLARIEAGSCEVTGIPFDFNAGRYGRRRNPFSPSIDQIIAGDGYSESNCRVVVTALNLALCEWGDGVFEVIAAAFLRNRGFRVSQEVVR